MKINRTLTFGHSIRKRIEPSIVSRRIYKSGRYADCPYLRVTTEASFTNDLGADSLDTVELIMEFEKEFGISIPDDQAEKIGTVGDAVSYIEEHAK